MYKNIFWGADGLLKRRQFCLSKVARYFDTDISFHHYYSLLPRSQPCPISKECALPPDHTYKQGCSQNFLVPQGTGQGAKEGLTPIHLSNMRGEKGRKWNQTSSWVQSIREPSLTPVCTGKEGLLGNTWLRGKLP